MTTYRLSLPTLAFFLFAMAASAATSNDAAAHPSMTDHQAVAASMPQADSVPARATVTVAPSAQAAASPLLMPQNYWWKDR